MPICSASDSWVTSRRSWPSSGDAPLGGVVEAGQQVGDGGLAGAAGAHQRHQLARLDLEGDVAQRPAAGRDRGGPWAWLPSAVAGLRAIAAVAGSCQRRDQAIPASAGVSGIGLAPLLGGQVGKGDILKVDAPGHLRQHDGVWLVLRSPPAGPGTRRPARS